MRWLSLDRKKIVTPDDLGSLVSKDGEPRALRHILFQWHITELCNLRCAHCYQNSFTDKGLPFETLLDILNGIRALVARLREQSPETTAHITITGGEPFMRPDFFALLEAIASDKTFGGFSILSNGSMITEGVAERLSALRPVFVQVSLDGAEKTHDAIRGGGAFGASTKGINALTSNGIRTLISFTAQSTNYREFPLVARLGAKLKVDRVWADRYIPFKKTADELNRVLSPSQTRELIELMAAASATKPLARILKTDMTHIAMHRALQFLSSNTRPYTCTAGRTLLAIEPNGDLLACRRLPIVAGNVLKENLTELYFKSPVLRNLRDRSRTIAGCADCTYSELCKGGLKCLSYAVHSDFFKKDPGCWL